MSVKPNEPRSNIKDLPEKKDELSAEALENAAGGMFRSPGGGLGRPGGLNETTQQTWDSNGMPDTTSSAYDS